MFAQSHTVSKLARLIPSKGSAFFFVQYSRHSALILLYHAAILFLQPASSLLPLRNIQTFGEDTVGASKRRTTSDMYGESFLTSIHQACELIDS